MSDNPNDAGARSDARRAGRLRSAGAALLVGLTITACSSGGGSSTAASSLSSSSKALPKAYTVRLIGTEVGNPGGKPPPMSHNSDNTECGMTTSGSATGDDEDGKVEIRDRTNKLLADGDIQRGDMTSLTTIPNNQFGFIGMTCDFVAILKVYEAPTDVALVTFTWPNANVTVKESVPASDFDDTQVTINHHFE